MPVPRDGDTLCPTGAVVLRGRRGVLDRLGPRSTWKAGECTWCGRVVPPGRKRLWCSDWCVDAYAATQPDTQRRLVEERDGGVCSSCGLDTARYQRVLRRLRHWLERGGSRITVRPRVERRIANLLALRGRPCSARQVGQWLDRRTPWDKDHRIPIADGGHPFDLRNLRTLCWWCHARETAEAATRRAERRRGAREQASDQVGLFDDP